VTDHFLRFANILAWGVLGLAATGVLVTVLAWFLNEDTSARAERMVLRNVGYCAWWAFVAGAWLYAGRGA
jgi:hypothetical protein